MNDEAFNIERFYPVVQTNAISAEDKSDAQRVLGAIGKVALEILVERAKGRNGGTAPTTADVLAEYERQQAEQRAAELAEQKKKQQTTLMIVIGGAVALLVTVGVLLYLKKRKK